MNSAHKASTEKSREGWERTFGKKEDSKKGKNDEKQMHSVS